MVIEVLFPELCNLYGDGANVRYLRACLPQAEFVETVNGQEPRFAQSRVDLLYLGSMAEPAQLLARDALRPYERALRRYISRGGVALVTGNALELLGQEIAQGEQREKMLGLYGFRARRDLEARHNSMFLGRFGEMPIVGYKSQFSFLYGAFPGDLFHVVGGYGNNPQDKNEGFRDGNLFATYLLGPLLVLNPLFTRYLLELAGYDGPLAFEEDLMEAFRYRERGLSEPGVRFLMGEHG